MKRFSSFCICILPLAVFLLFNLSSCGRKTLPVPPQSVLPEPIDDLRFSLDTRGAILSWSPPKKNATGQKLTSIKQYEIFRAESSADSDCQECPGTYSRLAIVTQQATSRRIEFIDTDLKPGHHYFYTVKTDGGWGLLSPDSNPVSFPWTLPLPPP
ncbi:hypothetical protein ACFL6N_05655 [Thermodesulfobacteriota bacterium]